MSDDRTSITEAGYTEEELPPEYSLAQKGLSEFVGAFTLIFVGAGSIIAANYAGGGVSGAGLVTIAIAHGLAIATMVTAIGHISGGHLNPAVTIAAFVTRKITAGDAGGYIVAQIAGAIAAAGLLRAAVDEAVWEAVDLGTPLLGDGVSAGQGVLIEAVLTFFLVWVVFATAIDPRGAFGKVAGLAIGFVILMDIMMGGPFTGAAMNPARAFGPALAGGVWDDHWVYWLGPVAGGVIAAVLYDALQMTPMGRGRRPDRRD
jgi:aquaporin TIP